MGWYLNWKLGSSGKAIASPRHNYSLHILFLYLIFGVTKIGKLGGSGFDTSALLNKTFG